MFWLTIRVRVRVKVRVWIRVYLLILCFHVERGLAAIQGDGEVFSLGGAVPGAAPTMTDGRGRALVRVSIRVRVGFVGRVSVGSGCDYGVAAPRWRSQPDVCEYKKANLSSGLDVDVRAPFQLDSAMPTWCSVPASMVTVQVYVPLSDHSHIGCLARTPVHLSRPCVQVLDPVIHVNTINFGLGTVPSRI